MPNTPDTISGRWQEILERVGEACSRAGRSPDSVRVVAVSKTFSAEQVAQAYEAGARIFGENYVQEALPKIAALEGQRAEWHFIGGLQSNKAKQVVGPFALIHSIDRWSLAEALHKAAEKSGVVVRGLLEVNIGHEATKSGVSPADLRALAERISSQTQIEIVGLMSFPPPGESPDDTRRFFAETRKLSEEAAGWNLPRIKMIELSMGISGDFEVAIEEGATLVRIGTAIFGDRE